MNLRLRVRFPFASLLGCFAAQEVIELGALRTTALVHAGLEMDEVEQALALNVAGAARSAGVGVLMFHGVRHRKNARDLRQG